MRTSLLLLLLVLVVPLQARAQFVLLNSGLGPPDPSTVIDHATYAGSFVLVRNAGCPDSPMDLTGPCSAPGAPTVVLVQPGGQVFTALAYDGSTVALAGGSVNGGDLGANDQSSVIVTSGTVNALVFADGDGVVEITGGSINAAVLGLGASSIDLEGGTFGGQIVADAQATIDIRGGLISGPLIASGEGSITLRGGDFVVDGVPAVGGGLVRGGAPGSGTLTATLANGDPLDLAYEIFDDAKIQLLATGVQICVDDDGDGYGNGSSGNLYCAAGVELDCNDGDPDVYPGAPEVCNGVDDDCDAGTDEGGVCDVSVPVGGAAGSAWLAAILASAGGLLTLRVRPASAGTRGAR